MIENVEPLLEGDLDRWNGGRKTMALVDEITRLRAALEKISAIRDSIVGTQSFNWSEHAYPLVAALNAAGFEGVGYKIASANLGTLIEQIKSAEADNERLRDLIASKELVGSGGYECPWCWKFDHAADCPAFSAPGVVR